MGTGSAPPGSKMIRYTGSDTPLNLETPGNRIVFTFVTDKSVAYAGFSVTVLSRRPAESCEYKFKGICY